jgi:hypothetical protein
MATPHARTQDATASHARTHSSRELALHRVRPSAAIHSSQVRPYIRSLPCEFRPSGENHDAAQAEYNRLLSDTRQTLGGLSGAALAKVEDYVALLARLEADERLASERALASLVFWIRSSVPFMVNPPNIRDSELFFLVAKLDHLFANPDKIPSNCRPNFEKYPVYCSYTLDAAEIRVSHAPHADDHASYYAATAHNLFVSPYPADAGRHPPAWLNAMNTMEARLYGYLKAAGLSEAMPQYSFAELHYDDSNLKVPLEPGITDCRLMAFYAACAGCPSAVRGVTFQLTSGTKMTIH